MNNNQFIVKIMEIQNDNIYDAIYKYKFFDYLSIDYNTEKYNKTTRWKFYDKENNLNILILDQMTTKILKNKVLVDTITKNLYILKEYDNFKYKKIMDNDVCKFVEEIKPSLELMNENYKNNINYIDEIQKIIKHNVSKDCECIKWKIKNIKKTIEYVEIYVNLFKNNNDKNIKVIKKQTNKNEKIEFYSINETFEFLKKISKDIDKNIELKNTVNENLDIKIQNLSINKKVNYEIRPKKEVSNDYKKLFIKTKLIDRLSVQSCKSKHEIMQLN